MERATGSLGAPRHLAHVRRPGLECAPRQSGAGGREVVYDFTREREARAMVGRLIATAPGGWKDITKLVRKLCNPGGGAPVAIRDEQYQPFRLVLLS